MHRSDTREVRGREIAERLAAIVGPSGLVTGADAEPYCIDWRGVFRGQALAVVRPASTEEVSAIVKFCAERRLPVVPQGGNTGMVGGGVPTPDGREIVLSLSRMARIRDVDPVDMSLIAEAGVPLAAAQKAAGDAGCLLPLTIGSQGSAQIGGVVATNAGGNNAVRYGSTRDLVLGLEVVLPDGAVWNGLRRLRKDNAGYALRHLFTGSEGTLGIITAAVLRLFPPSLSTEVAFCGVRSLDAALALFNRFQRRDGPSIQAFEYMSKNSLDLVLRHIPGAKSPIAADAQHYVLIELATPRENAHLRALMEDELSSAMENDLVIDVAVAQNERQRAAFWRLREDHTESQQLAGASIKNDVSVQLSRIPDLIRRGTEACHAVLPAVRVAPFGHLGDGNIHFNLICPEDMSPAEFMARGAELTSALNAVVIALDGSFAAEHGIGRLKMESLLALRSPIEIDLMRRIRQAINPGNLVNPDRIFR